MVSGALRLSPWGIRAWGVTPSSLTLWSEALEKYADDILRGVFTLFTPLEAKVRARLREHPEIIQVYAPEDAPPEQIAWIEQGPGEHTGRFRLSCKNINALRAGAKSPLMTRSSHHHEHS
jgi:hypothetical protein